MKGATKFSAGLFFLGILAVIVVAAVYSQGFSLQSIIGQGTLSVSNIDYKINDGGFNKVWFMTVTQGTAANEYTKFKTGSIDLEDGSVKSENGFTLTMSLDEQTCSYPISQKTTLARPATLGTLEATNIGNPIPFVENLDYFCDKKCFGVYGTDAVCVKPKASLSVYCVHENLFGTVGEFGPYERGYEGTITVASDSGEVATAKINSKDSSIAEIKTSSGEKIGTASFLGFISSTKDCSDYANNYYVIYSGSWNKWIDRDSWIILESIKQSKCSWYYSVASNGKIDGSLWKSDIDACVGAVNLAMEKVTYQTGTGSGEGSLSKGVWTVDWLKQSGNVHAVPLTTLRLDATWLGIQSLQGIPKIISLGEATFETGKTGSVPITIKNEGTFEGSFQVGAVCDGQATIESTLVPNMKPSETRSLTLKAYGTSDKITEAITCTVTVTDSGGAKDSKTTVLNIKGITWCKDTTFCLPGGTGTGELTLLYKCNDAGTDKVLVEDCSLRGADWTCMNGACVEQSENCALENQISSVIKPCCAGLKADVTGKCVKEGDRLSMLIKASLAFIAFIVVFIVLTIMFKGFVIGNVPVGAIIGAVGGLIAALIVWSWSDIIITAIRSLLKI